MSWLALSLVAVSVVEVSEVPRGQTVLVLSLQSEPQLASPGRALSEVVARELAARGDRKVFTEADLEQMVELEGQRQVAGCDQTSCLAEVAGAMGAELVLFGDLTGFGETYVATLRLFDSRKALVVGRELVEGPIEVLPRGVREAVERLLPSQGPADDVEPAPAPKALPTLPLAVMGVGAAFAAAGYGMLLFDNFVVLGSPTSTNTDGALDAGPWWLATALAGTAVMGAGAGLWLLE